MAQCVVKRMETLNVALNGEQDKESSIRVRKG